MDRRLKKQFAKIMYIVNNYPISEEKNNILSRLFEETHKYCYLHNLDFYKEYEKISNYNELVEASYIIESEPLIFEVDEEKTKNAYSHLKEVLENGGGISEEEAKCLIEWSIQKARIILNKSCHNGIKNASLSGCCGNSQMLTLSPFLKAGVETTINNVFLFGEGAGNHAFGTITLPILDNNKVVKKQYLLDATYRQFFTTIRANEGRFYVEIQNGLQCAPDSGYFMVNYLNGKEIANEILKKGYIELTDEVLKKYIGSFYAERLNRNTIGTMYNMYRSIDPKLLRNIIKNRQQDFDYDEEEIEEALEITNFPGAGITNKKL